MFLTAAPLWLTGLLLVGVVTIVAMLGPVVARRGVGLAKLRTNNEVAGFKFATVGVLYAVLLGFAVIVVWEKFSDAEASVALEAGAAATVYRLADGLPADSATELRDGIVSYLKVTIAEDWPAMERGGHSPAARMALDKIYAGVLRYQPKDLHGQVVMTETLRQLDQITQTRRARMVLSDGIVPGVLWMVLFGGGFLTIGFTFFFGTENLRAQMAMTGALSVLILSGLLIIISIDHPFAGAVKVEPTALVEVLGDFEAGR